MTDSNIHDLCPELLTKYRQWLIECHAVPLAVKAIVTWRSGVDQDAAQAAGLSKACAGQSPHNCIDTAGLPSSRAFDFAVFDEDGNYIKDGTDWRYTKAGEIAKSLGLVWGGDFVHAKPDYDHIEIFNWKH